jgi:hypothetical protein
MNQHSPEAWRNLARLWQTGTAPVTRADIERLHERQRWRLQVARAAELACTVLGVTAAVWLALASRFRWVGILTAVFSLASVYFVLRVRRKPDPPGSTDLIESLKNSLDYQDWLAEQLRYGRVLGFVSLFSVVMAASTQLMHMTGTAGSALLAMAIAGLAINGALAWNMSLAWQVWRRTVRLRAFKKKLMELVEAGHTDDSGSR